MGGGFLRLTDQFYSFVFFSHDRWCFSRLSENVEKRGVAGISEEGNSGGSCQVGTM
jgi:hypothetical protein